MTRRGIGMTLIALVGLGTMVATYQQRSVGARMQAAALAFLQTLDADRARQATMAFDDAERYVWFYTPVDRKGLPLEAMSDAQREAALALVRAGLSASGFDKAETIRQLEVVLFEMSGRAIRDPDLYYVTIFGTPGPTGTWGWRYEGHHLSQHWTVTDGTAASSTPQFFGANPAEVRTGSMRGTRALAAEEDRARALLRSLTASQRAEAIIDPVAPSDILTTNDRTARRQADAGVTYATLDASQQRALVDLIELYASAQPDDIAADRLARLRAAGLDAVRFAWMGGTEPGDGHYYRIQGPTFLIEYDNTQNDANHIHCVWRDFDGDFGEDLIAAHYRAVPHRATVE